MAVSIGSEYKYVDESLHFEQADLRCLELYGTHLATIRSPEDIQIAEDACEATHCWIGLYEDTNNNNKLTWKSGESLPADAHGMKFILDNDGPCMRVVPHLHGFADMRCNFGYRFLCDFNVETVCDSDKPYNILFILDESESVGESNYISSIDFVIKRIEEDINSIANIAVLSYSSLINERVYEFIDDQSSRDDILTKLELEKADYDSGNTNTFQALSDGLEQFEDNFVDTDNNLVFLITDGKPTDSNGNLDLNAICDNANLLRRYREYNIRVIVIGITDGFDKSAISCIANNGDIFEIQDFTNEDFESIESELRNILCPCD